MSDIFFFLSSHFCRGMQSRGLLQELLTGVLQARDEVASIHESGRRPKLVLKIAPDLSEAELEDVAAAVRASGVDGVIVSNTTVKRPPTLRDGQTNFCFLVRFWKSS